MKAHPARHARRGSALITVLFLLFIMGLLTTSILRYSNTEKRFNERQRLILRARNMAENVVIYASEQVIPRLNKLRGGNPTKFTGILLPPNNVLTSKYSTPADVEVSGGLTATMPLAYIDPTAPENADNPKAGLQIAYSVVPIIAKSTMRHAALGAVTSYAEQTLEVASVPLFQFAVFYNMDMEFGPGPNMTISGPVHTNGDFIARIQTGYSNTLRFMERVSTAKGFYANTAHKGPSYGANGAADNGPGGTGPLLFQRPGSSVTPVDIKNSSGVWRDHKWTSSNTPGSVAETETSRALFKNFATSTYAGNLRTREHGVERLDLPSVGGYDENDPVKKKNGRQIIDVPASTDASNDLLATKFARNAGLYIIVNPDSVTRTGHKPDGTTVSMRPRSYRAFLNTVSLTGTHTITEVVLPGQPSYGENNAYVNTLPNAYRVNTAVGSNQVLRIPQGNGTGFVDLPDTGYAWIGDLTPPDFDSDPTPTEVLSEDAYFYDMRRAYNNIGQPFNRSSSLRFRPRPIAKIDFDMTRFKMAVQRTLFGDTSTSVYNPARPNNSNWSSSIFNSGASAVSTGLGLSPDSITSFNDFPSRDLVSAVQRAQSSAYVPATIQVGSTSATNSSTTAAYNARFVVETTTATPNNASGTYTGWSAASGIPTGDVSSFTYTPAAGITAIRIAQYQGGNAPHSSRLLDEQIIPVISETGTGSGLNASLTNDVAILAMSNSSTFAGHAFDQAVTEMRVFVNGADDTANWVFSAGATTNGMRGFLGGATTTQSAHTGRGAFANRYTATTMDPASSTSSVVITASKPTTSGTISVSRTFTLKKQTLSPTSTSYWITAGGMVSPDPFRIYRAPTTATEVADALTTPSNYNLGLTDFVVTGTTPSPWFDGITVYVESVDAENLATSGSGNSIKTNRIASGVRLWNGRGPLVSLPGASYPNRTGFSFATNDAVYIVGHYNADGSTDSNTSHNYTGGYSGAWPESSTEMLAAVMGDALTILSQPEFSQDTGSTPYRYWQTSGWSDSMSASVRDDSASSPWSSFWFSSNPSNSNTLDGLKTDIQPALMPNLTVSSSVISADTNTVTRRGPRAYATGTPNTRTSKFAPSETEVSSCLLTGIVPTTVYSAASGSNPMKSGQTSGGVHNFPRLSENWAGSVALYIRGSLVAMFESQVATEPWGIRWYQGAIRNWGLHQSLRSASHDVPLEPVVIGARRMSYRELTPSEYEAQKAAIAALP